MTQLKLIRINGENLNLSKWWRSLCRCQAILELRSRHSTIFRTRFHNRHIVDTAHRAISFRVPVLLGKGTFESFQLHHERIQLSSTEFVHPLVFAAVYEKVVIGSKHKQMRPSHDDGFNVSQFQSSWTQFFCYLSGLLFKSWLEREKNILQKVLMFFSLHWRRFWAGTSLHEGEDMRCRKDSWKSNRIYESS